MPVLTALSEEEAARQPAPGKWSPKEILGHLIDSAANNHGRFVRAQLQDDLVFEGYAQDAWVMLQQYTNADWQHLVILWRLYNLHIARVVSQIPPETLRQQVTRHNFHQIAFHTVPEDQPATLGYFIDDYTKHLVHHLNQIKAITAH